jgi:hypothetical protein
MEQNCYRFYESSDKHYSVVHFSEIAGWHIWEEKNEFASYTPFDQNRVVFPVTNDRSVYEAWLNYKNGDLLVEKVETSSEINGFKVSETSEDEIDWDGVIVPMEEIMHWVMTTDELNPIYRVIAPVVQGQYSKVELTEMGGADAEAKYEKWRQWSIKNGNTYPTLDEMQA